jgi:serine protease AprX
MINVASPRLDAALQAGAGMEFFVAAAPELRAAADPVPLIPVILQIGRLRPGESEEWRVFKDRVGERLGQVVDDLHSEVGVDEVVPLYAGNALGTAMTMDQLALVAQHPGIIVEYADLDPLLPVVALDGVAADIGLHAFTAAGGGTGAGVTVAVLDSGIDTEHPALVVSHQVETCGEPNSVPGAHGTHCAGILASRDSALPGVAPGVELIDVKVLRANGTGRHTWIGQGVDAALDLGANVLSMSLGFNHLPTSFSGGHGWSCPDGTCPLCLAVDNAVAEGALVVAAAGNEHERCQQARMGGSGLMYDTEITCPGHAAGALTVGSHCKKTHGPAWSSSSGPTAYGGAKPDLCAPGVDVLSTIPLPRDGAGVADRNAHRSLQFGVMSGTSMATPAVAGACALLIESSRAAGLAADPGAIRRLLLAGHVQPVGGPANVLGAGRLRLA